MGDSAFSLPTLLIIVPAAGGLIALSMLTRRAAALTSFVTFLIQAALLVVGAFQLDRFAERTGGGIPDCSNAAASDGTRVVLAQCSSWFPQWGIEYSVSLGYGALGLVALTTLVTAGASAFAWWADRERPAAMQGLLWLTAAALTGLFVARDLVLFYVFFELMLVPMLLLVGVWGGAQRIRATMTMFIYTLLGSLPMLVGVIGVGVAANAAIAELPAGEKVGINAFSLPELSALVASGDLALSSWILASFLLAFAIKAPLLPFHGWLPLAYREAPAEVTAMLSGLVSKAAFFGMLVIVLPLFPTQLAGGWGTALTWVALASLVYGCLAAFRQPDPRGVVAYSSLAQMGLIMLGLASFTGEGAAQGVSGAYLQSINHGLVSAAAFLLVGIIELRTGEREFARLGFLATGRARLASIGLVVALITLAVPGATTFAGELLILAGVFRGDVSGPLVATIGSLAVVLAAMYALRLVAGLVFSDRDTTRADAAAAHERFGADLGMRELLIVGPAIVALLVLSAWPNLAHRAMNQPPVGIVTPADPLVTAAAAGAGRQGSDTDSGSKEHS